MKLPSYLRLTKHNIFVFRRRIPAHLQQYFKTNEIRQSLGETRRRLAIINSRRLAAESDNLFYSLENNLPVEKVSIGLLNLLSHKKELLRKDAVIDSLRTQLESTHLQNIRASKAISKQHEREINLIKGLVTTPFEHRPKPLKSELKLTEAINLFFEPGELVRRRDKPATIRKNKDGLKFFVEIIGDKFVSEIGQSDAVRFAKEVPTYGCPEGKKRAENTVNGFMNSINKFSGWVTAFHSDAGHIQLNFARLRYKKPKAANKERDAFTDDEVMAILTHPKMEAFKKEDPAKYWLPQIAAYSGMRLEEITQLDPNTDIYQENGVWLFDANEEDEKSLKNNPSIRRVPIHSKLIELGLIEYVESVKSRKARMLFPDEIIRDGRTGKNAGKRANRFIFNVIGVKGKTLHSFRHSIATKLKRKLVEEAITAALLGHEYGNITYNRYGKDYLSETLREAIEKVYF